MKPLISIITINYNQTEVTIELLRSIERIDYASYEVILVDNASHEDPSERVKREFPQVKIIRSEENLGFAGGNNLGMRYASGDYFFFVNNDTELTPDLLDKLLQPFTLFDKVGVVSPKIKYFNDQHLIQYAGFTSVNPFTGRNKKIGELEPDFGQYDKGQFTAYAHGAAMMVKRSVVEEVGPMPEVYFLLYEELDWCTQIRRAGYEIYYEGSATIYHKESVSMGKESPLKAYYYLRNRILFMRRNFSGLKLGIFYIYTTLLVIPKILLKYLIKQQNKHIGSVLRALRWHLSGHNQGHATGYPVLDPK